MKTTFLASLASLFFSGVACAADATVGWKDLSFTLEDLGSTPGFTPWLNATQHTQCTGVAGGVIGCTFERVSADYRLSSESALSASASLGSFVPPDTLVSYDAMDFVLSPNTRLTISGVLIADVTGSEQSVDDWGDLLVTSYADAWGSVQLRLGPDFGNTELLGAHSFSVSVVSSERAPLMSWLAFDMYAGSDAGQIFTSPSPVPEPATSTLMLAGLNALCLFGHRRGRRLGSPRRAGDRPDLILRSRRLLQQAAC